MKKHIFLSLLAFICLSVCGQDYVPFPTSNAIWSEVFKSQQPDFTETYQYGIQGDTVFNELVYKKVYLLSDTLYPLITAQYCGAIREDSQKRMYAYIDEEGCFFSEHSGELLLYDFGKGEGDTIRTADGTFHEYIISHIDSVLCGSAYRKRFHFINFEEEWIEGVGSTRSLFAPLMAFTTGFQKWELICLNHDQIIQYQNPDYSSCFPLLTSVNTQIGQAGLIIQPHPLNGLSRMLLPGNPSDYTRIDFFDISGKLIKQLFPEPGAQQLIIQKSDFSPGLYIYCLISTNEVAITGKMVVL